MVPGRCNSTVVTWVRTRPWHKVVGKYPAAPSGVKNSNKNARNNVHGSGTIAKKILKLSSQTFDLVAGIRIKNFFSFFFIRADHRPFQFRETFRLGLDWKVSFRQIKFKSGFSLVLFFLMNSRTNRQNDDDESFQSK